ncbi:T-cell surface glycoprotein CD3 zeta chain-like [Anoplopoma fimbria]|uniref:T-cell surface glycoprotein CD3 zeta chain-like n=1 Tax=Anoplopoma fimbria TaxID=229290 RepID=UPI0023ED75D8|nr:T-cell surface glycoprotein CD3 zeta chain-like [Anoplopoma fimbria]
MELQIRVSGLLVLVSVFPPAEAVAMYSPQLCYILDGFLGLYGLIITAMFIKEKFFTTKVKGGDDLYMDPEGQAGGGYSQLMRDRNQGADDTYTGLTRRTEGEYKELPVKRDRQRKNDQIYQGLSAASRDTYDSLQMQPLPAR